MSSVMIERPLPIEINAGYELGVVTFSASGEYLLGSGRNGNVGVWRVQDGQRMGMMIQAWDVNCFAVSEDGRFIAASSWRGVVQVIDAKTHKTAWDIKEDVRAVDFSPDSTRLVSGSWDGTATIWDTASSDKLLELDHDHTQGVIAVRYSPDGNRIATATYKGSIRVWDSDDGRLLIDIPIAVSPQFSNALRWFNNNHIFIVSGREITQLDALTGSIVSEWTVSATVSELSSIALPKRREVIAHSTRRSVTLWDTSTYSQLALYEHPEDIRSIALSPCGSSLAIGGKDGKIIIGSFVGSTDSTTFCLPHLTLQSPRIQIDNVVLDAWKHDQLEDADLLLTTALNESQSEDHHLLAARAIVRARLGYLDAALLDADRAIEIQPSVIAYTAKSLAHCGKGEKNEAYRACDIALEHFHSSHVTLLLIIKAIIIFMTGEHLDAVSRMDDLIATVRSIPTCYTAKAYMYLHMGNTHMEHGNYECAIQSFESARAQVLYDWHPLPFVASLMSGWKVDNLHIVVRRRLCDALYAAGREDDAREYFLEMVNEFGQEVYTDEAITKWVSEFTQRYLCAPEYNNDTTLTAIRDTDMAMHHSITPLLREWAKAKLAHDSWQTALRSASFFVVPRSAIYRMICERLEAIGRAIDASECLRQMVVELFWGGNIADERVEWVLKKLECLGDVTMNIERHNVAISLYSDALSLNPPTPQRFLIKRGRAYMAEGLWEKALNDANNAIELDSSSPWGYEIKHAALHNAKDYENAVSAFETMRSRMADSSDPEIRVLHNQHVDPQNTREAIRTTVQNTIRDLPRVLINTLSGRLVEKTEQAASFESLSVFNELVSSMTNRIDSVRIEREVEKYYRYGTFSHKWGANEPSFNQVIRIVIHDLEESPSHNKLKMFCKIVQDAGLHWAWSDTCCINKRDQTVLQEALVSMFKWYQSSSLTVVFLFDVTSPSRRGDLMKSIWNTRAWTFQEYHASRVIQFYTKDWKMYLNLDIPNHKESPEIISEMEEATGVPVRALRPGLDDIRRKLCLASTREATFVEDAAYSLLGIFSMSLPVMYGEGDQALGRLLAQLLASSGDATILAWTGKSGSSNSCLPTNIIVFNQLVPLHVPQAVATNEMERITTTLRTSLLNPALVVKLYDQLHDLPLPLFAGRRLKLPCLTFKLGPIMIAGRGVFRAQTDALGIVEFRAEVDLSRFNTLYLVHPWIDFLLGRQPVGSASAIERIPNGNTKDYSSPTAGPSNIPVAAPKNHMAVFGYRLTLPFGAPRAKDPESLLPPATVSQEDKRRRAHEAIARLKQPFGALLLAQNPDKVVVYNRVATETVIKVRLVEEITPGVLNKLVSSVRVLDVL